MPILTRNPAGPTAGAAKVSPCVRDLSDALQIEMDLWREKDKDNLALGALGLNTHRSTVSENSTAPGSARTSVSSTVSQCTPSQDPLAPPVHQRRSSKSSMGSHRSTPSDPDRRRSSKSSHRSACPTPEGPAEMGEPTPPPRKADRRSRFMSMIRGDAAEGPQEEREQKALVPHHRVVAAIERRQQRFPESKALSLSSIEKTFEPQEWLTDASINFVYTLFNDCGLDIKHIGLPESMQRKEDARLPKSILLMDPAIAFWLTIEQDASAVSEATKKLELRDRRLVACPVNDNWDGGRANGGSHWSLLVGWAGATEGDFSFIHYDSMATGHGDDSSYRHAQLLAARLVGQQVAVSQGACPQQANSYDCGVYVLMFSATVAGAVLTAGKGPVAKRGQPVWEKDFKLLTPREVTKRRGQYYQMAKADI